MAIPAESFVRSSFFTISAAFIGKILNFFGSILIAAYFGADARTDLIFFVLLLLQSILPFFTDFNQNVLIPTFINLKATQQIEKAWGLVGLFLFRLSVIIILLSLVLFFAIDKLLFFLTDFSSEVRQESLAAIWLLLPLLLLNYMNDLIINVFQAHKNYALSNIATILQGVCLIVFILFWFRLGIVAIASGFLGGAVLQLGYAVWLLRRYGIRFRLLWDTKLIDYQLGSFVIPILIFPLLSLVYNFAPVYLAAGLESGTLTAINFARRLYLFIPTLFVYPLVLVLYPRLCEQANIDRQSLSSSLLSFHNLLLVLVMPLALFFSFFANEVSGLAFSYGKYSGSALEISSQSLRLLAPGAVMSVLVSITGRAVFSTRDLRIVRANLIVNIVGAIIFPIILYFLRQNYGYVGLVFGSTIFLFLFHGITNWCFIYFFVGAFKVGHLLLGYVQNLLLSWFSLAFLWLIKTNYAIDSLCFLIFSFVFMLVTQMVFHAILRTNSWRLIRFYITSQE